MKLTCTFEDFIFNNGDKFYQRIIKDQEVPQNSKFEFSGQHLPKKYDPDVTFIEFRDCKCPKVPQGLTKTFPNLKVLSICNSKLKDISKDDMAEYKNLFKFICHKNEVDFLPGDLFEGFEDLTYIKFTSNKLGVIEPNLFDNLYRLEYINFKSNPDIHKFSADAAYQRSVNAMPGEVKVAVYFNFLNGDIKFIRNYIHKTPDPSGTLNYLKLYANSHKSKLNILELKYELYEASRATDVDEIKNDNEKFKLKLDELESLNDKVNDDVKELEESDVKISQQLEECSKDLQNVKEENSKIKKNLQSQIDDLVRQFQSIMFERKSK
ncbi:unnamed protein product [Chironomus riparius]|uniref:Uncharacterized protein n=1 Tax=Chironomus riparius TaxID=315576 RepID=A0A9N9X0P9_9DIPT|nr:unnamed protein product [Chironomus riparius]